MAKLIDLTGQKFDKLLVLEKAPSRARHVYWKCKCDCGNECEISSESLRRQNIPHNCGICELEKTKKEIRKKRKTTYLIGKKFGKLTVINSTEERINNSIVWHCRCECGNEIDVDGSNLRRGLTKSCGCINYSIGELNIKKYFNRK